MPLILKKRRADLVEFMDRSDVDLVMLFRTYDRFRVINPLLARWKHLYKTEIRPVLSLNPRRAHTLLDIGCGGGDVMESLSRHAAKDGFKLSVTGIDPDGNAEAYLKLRKPRAHLHFRKATSAQLVAEGLKFDFVISNHVLHHLDEASLVALMGDAEHLARRLVLFNDIERGDFAWLAFTLTWPLFVGSFITPDGLTSIRRSYTRGELSELARLDWCVRRVFPYRLVLFRKMTAIG